jgi:hypothetical protein
MATTNHEKLKLRNAQARKDGLELERTLRVQVYDPIAVMREHCREWLNDIRHSKVPKSHPSLGTKPIFDTF